MSLKYKVWERTIGGYGLYRHKLPLHYHPSWDMQISLMYPLSSSSQVRHRDLHLSFPILDPDSDWRPPDAGRWTKFAPVKSLDSSEFSSEFSDLNFFYRNVKVNPIISWNGQHSFHRIFFSNSQDFTALQISFEFSRFYYTSNSCLIKPINTNHWKTCPFREILSQLIGTGNGRVD